MAAIKLGWETVGADFPGTELCFFGASKARMSELRQRGSLLFAASRSLQRRIAFTSGGAGQIELADFDAVLLAGLGYGLPLPPDPRLSSAVRHEALAGAFARTLSGRILGLVRQARPEMPVDVMPNPLRRRAQADGTEARDHPAYALRLALSRPAVARGPGPVRLVGQPPDTLFHEGHTAGQYGIGAIGLDQGGGPRPKGEEDTSHMNIAYGIAFLRHWLTDPPQATAPQMAAQPGS